MEPPPVEFLTYVRNVPCTYACFETDGYAQDRPLKQVRRYDNLSGSELEKAVSVCMGGGNARDHSSDGRRLTPAPPKPPKAPLAPTKSIFFERELVDERSKMDRFYEKVDAIDISATGVSDQIIDAACEYLRTEKKPSFDTQTQVVLDDIEQSSTSFDTELEVEAPVASDDSVDQEERSQAAPASVVVAEAPLREAEVGTADAKDSSLDATVVASSESAATREHVEIVTESPVTAEPEIEAVASVVTLEPEAEVATQAPVDLEAVVMPVVDTAAPLFSEPVVENEAEESTQAPADLDGSVMQGVDTGALPVSEGVAETEVEVATQVPADLEGSVMPVVDTAALSVSEGVAETEVEVATQVPVDLEGSVMPVVDTAALPVSESVVDEDEVKTFMEFRGPVRSMLLDLGRKLHEM